MEVGNPVPSIELPMELFDDALNSFDRVQFGSNFNANFQYALLRLDIARLSLSRWGRVIGLSDEHEQNGQAETLPIDHDHIQSRLENITGVFCGAEQNYFRLKDRTQPGGPEPTVLQKEANLDPSGQSLHETLRSLAVSRRNNTDIRPKRDWILNSESEFDELVGPIMIHINSLVEAIPATLRVHLRQLCEKEVTEIGTKEKLRMLWEIASALDHDLRDAISKALADKESASNTWNNSHFNNYNCKINNFNRQVGTEVNNAPQTFHF